MSDDEGNLRAAGLESESAAASRFGFLLLDVEVIVVVSGGVSLGLAVETAAEDCLAAGGITLTGVVVLLATLTFLSELVLRGAIVKVVAKKL